MWNRDPDACTKAVRVDAHGTIAQKLTSISGYCTNVCKFVAAHTEAASYSKKSCNKGSSPPSVRTCSRSGVYLMFANALSP